MGDAVGGFTPLDGSVLKRFERHIAESLRVSDDYVWVYSEGGTWIDWDQKKGDKALMKPTWETQFPGLAEMFRSAKGAPATPRICDAGLVNLVRNSDCDPVAGQALPYASWTDDKKGPNPFAYESVLGASKPGCLKLVGDGFFVCDVVGGMKKGDRILIAAKARGRAAALEVVWSSKGTKIWNIPFVDVGPLAEMGEDRWTELVASAEVPDGEALSVKLIDGLCIRMKGACATPDHPVYFDDIRVLTYPAPSGH